MPEFLETHKGTSFMIYGCILAFPISAMIVISWYAPWRDSECGPLWPELCDPTATVRLLQS